MTGKIKTQTELKHIVEKLKGQGKTIVFANGCFDLLHVGHIRYLAGAKALGDILIVGLNSDQSARKIKGPGRPIVPEDERAEVLSALEMVDYIVIFSEPTPEAVITGLRPDIQSKGADYTPQTVPEAPLVASYGGSVAITGDPKAHSTSDLIERIKSIL